MGFGLWKRLGEWKNSKNMDFYNSPFSFFRPKNQVFESVGPTPTPPTTKPTLKINIIHKMSIGGGLRLLAPLRADLYPKKKLFELFDS